MQKVGLPPIRSGIQINTIASREPPTRSWSRYKKLLIDNPKDANLLQRQKLWNFQKLNRGAFRSQIASLPDIPYRVKQNVVAKISVGVQANLQSRYSKGLKVIFPNLAARRNDGTESPTDENDGEDENAESGRNKACSPMQEDEEFEYEDDFEDDSSIDDPGLEFESVVRTKNAGTMTIPGRKEKQPVKKEKRKKPSRDRDRTGVKKGKKSILVSSSDTSRPVSPKVVSFAPDDKDPEQTPDVEGPVVPKVEIEKLPQTSREASMHSVSSGGSYIKMPVENIGHSSQLSSDPLSVLDFLSGSRTDRSSRMTDPLPNKTPRDRYKRRTKATDPEADRVWFEKIVGDKEIVDVATYENFARTRPNTESQSDSTADRIIDFTKVYTRKNFTPRINDEFPQYHSVMAKDNQNTQNKKPPPPSTVNKGRGSRRGFIGIGKSY